MKNNKKYYLSYGIYKDTVKEIFNNMRNFVVISLIMAAGVYAIRNPEIESSFNTTLASLAGGIVLIIGLLLMILNIVDGIYYNIKAGFRKSVYIPVGIIYSLITIRLVFFILELRLQ